MSRKKIRTIKIDATKCTGCRACEVVCSAFHSGYSRINRERSRIRVIVDHEEDIYVPIIAGPYTLGECPGRYEMTIGGKNYDECFFCRVSCPSRDIFKEPDSGLPLKCDMCGEPSQSEPMCVKWCLSDALTHVEREEEGEEEDDEGERERAVEYLIDKYGAEEIRDVLDRKIGVANSQKKKK
jgi:benzoyl-CoA reductase subunit BamC